MKYKRMKVLEPADRIRSKSEARRVLRDAKKISKRLLKLENIPDIMREVDNLGSKYSRASYCSAGDNRLYDSIKEDAIYRFGMIADYVRNRFGPGDLTDKIERYKARYIPAY